MAARAASLAAIATAVWALLWCLGALVIHATTWFGVDPAIWSLMFMVTIVKDPSYESVAIGFLCCAVMTTGLVWVATLAARRGRETLGAPSDALVIDAMQGKVLQGRRRYWLEAGRL